MLPLSFVGVPVEMTKRRWRDLVQALYESHFDPRKDEQLKQSKLDVENKLPKIFKLVREGRQNRKNRNAEANARKESELIGLIEDFHKQYQFVYDLYDNLRDQLSETVNNSNKEEEGYFTATSSSDSESDSENDVNTANLSQEKESIQFDHMEKMKKVQQNNRTFEKLEEKSRVLQEQLKKREQELSRLAQMQMLRQKEASGLMKELELELSSFNIKLNAICKEKRPAEVQTENKGLQAQVESLEKNAKKMDEDFSSLVNGNDTDEGGFLSEVSKIKELIVQVNQLKQNVDYLNTTKKVNSVGSTSHENLLDQVNKMKDDLGTLRKKNSDLEWKIKKKSRENSDLLSQIDSCKREFQSKAQRMQKEKEDAQVRLKNIESEVQNVSNQRNEVERQMLRKDQENVELKQELERLQEKAVNMEKILKEREDQLRVLQGKFDNGEGGDKPAQIVSLISQINNPEHDLGSKNFERRLKMKNQEIIKLTSEREFLQRRVRELENKLQDRGDELSKLRNNMSTQIVALTRQVNELQEETDMKKKLEDQISCQEKEIRQLVDEKECLQAKILELEITSTEKEDEIASLQRRVLIGENEASARVSGLTSQINYFQEALSSERKKSLEKLTHMENQNSELTSKLSNQQAILKQQEDNINKLREDCKLVKGRFLQAADRKMDEVAHEFRKNFEDKFRMLSQRIRVAEQLHAEDKDNLKKIKKRCEEVHPGIERKLKELMSSKNADFLKLSQAVDEMMKGMEHLINEFDIKEGSFLQRLSRVSDDVQVAKNWVRWTMDEMKPWKNEPSGSPFAPIDEKEQEKIMKEKVRRLEAKVNKEKGDKLRLVRGMYDFQRKIADLERTVAEKDEGLLRLGEEKVEAIRQLCMWIDYHQSRFVQFKEMMLAKKKAKIRGRW